MLYWVSSMRVRKSVTALNYLILVYLGVPHFFNIHVDYEVHTLPNHCNENFYTFSYILSMIYDLSVYCCLPLHGLSSQLYPCHTILYLKVTTKSDVVGCHVGQWPSSTNWNRYNIPVDCCVNAFLPLLSSMGSFTAKMVVLRRVCEVPIQRQKLSPHWSNPPSTTN